MHAPKSRSPSRRSCFARAGCAPVEAAGVDEEAADHGAVARQELRRRMDDEVGAVVEGPHEPRGGERRIDEKRQSVLVRERGHTRHVEDFEARIAERLAEEQPRLRPDRRAPRVEVARVDERRLDPEARQRVVQQVVRAAVERARRDDVRAGRHERHDREMKRRLPARRRDRPDAALERRDALFQHRARRVRQPRVDVARALHVEERRRVVAVAEDERRRLVDRRRAGAGDGIRTRPRVQGQRVEAVRLRLRHFAGAIASD